MGCHFLGQSGVVFGAALKVCLLAFQLALAICKKSGAFFCIDEDQRNTLIVIKKREMLIDAPIVGYRQISQAVFIVKSAVGTEQEGRVLTLFRNKRIYGPRRLCVAKIWFSV